MNILQITTHDSGRHFGCYGHPALHTPRIDALAADGVRCDRCFTVTPICCASRATMLTGRYPQSHGLLDLWFEPFGWRLRDGEQHLALLLRQAGYRTVLLGMQHEVAENEVSRLEFDDVVGPLMQPSQDLAPKVVAFLDSPAAKAQPFFAQVGLLETHVPWNAPPDTEKGLEVPPYLEDGPALREQLALLQGSIRKVDQAVGDILDALQRNGLENDTLVVFTTDHGIEMPRAKWHLHDPGVEVAMILRCPALGLTGGRTVRQLVSHVDYVPSILELAGLAVPPSVQGCSFAAALRGDVRPVREAVYGLYHKNQTRSVRTERYKLIRHFDAAFDYACLPVSLATAYKTRCIACGVELYDLQEDPREFINLAATPGHQEVLSRLDALLWRWLDSVNDPILEGPIASPAYLKTVRQYRRWKDSAPDAASR